MALENCISYGCFSIQKLVLHQIFHETDLEIWGHSREMQHLFYSQIFTFLVYLRNSPIVNHWNVM